MINGHMDLELITFTLGQYILVLLVGFLAFYGLIALIKDLELYSIKSINNKIDIYKQKQALYEQKEQYRQLKKYYHPGLFRSIGETLINDEDYEEENEDQIVEDKETEIVEGPKVIENPEVDILSLNEELSKDPDFLSHVDDSASYKKLTSTSNSENKKVISKNDINRSKLLFRSFIKKK